MTPASALGSARRIAGFATRLLRPEASGRPPRVTAILTERCHLKCSFCQLWQAPESGVSTDDWIRFFAANPFLRSREESVVSAARNRDPSAEPGAKTLGIIRQWKDNW